MTETHFYLLGAADHAATATAISRRTGWIPSTVDSHSATPDEMGQRTQRAIDDSSVFILMTSGDATPAAHLVALGYAIGRYNTGGKRRIIIIGPAPASYCACRLFVEKFYDLNQFLTSVFSACRGTKPKGQQIDSEMVAEFAVTGYLEAPDNDPQTHADNLFEAACFYRRQWDAAQKAQTASPGLVLE